MKAIGANASEFREKAGDIARQVAFAGLATIWIFRLDSVATTLLPTELVRPAALLVLTLAFDLLEYVAGTLIWGTRPSFVLKAREQRNLWAKVLFSVDRLPGGNEHLVSRPVRWLFWLKISALISAYALLLRFLAPKAQVF